MNTNRKQIKVFFSQPMRGIPDEVIEANINNMMQICSKGSYILIDSFFNSEDMLSLQEYKKFAYNLVTSADMLVYDNYDIGLNPTVHREIELATECGISCYSLKNFIKGHLKMMEILGAIDKLT